MIWIQFGVTNFLHKYHPKIDVLPLPLPFALTIVDISECFFSAQSCEAPLYCEYIQLLYRSDISVSIYFLNQASPILNNVFNHYCLSLYLVSLNVKT